MTNLNLGFLRAATICNNSDIKFSIIDFNNKGDNYHKLKGVLTNKNVALAIISLDIKAIKSAFEITHFIKREAPSIKVMWCSLGIGFYVPFAILFKETVLKSKLIDYVLHGSENDLSNFFEEFFKGVSDFTASGIGYKLNSIAIFNPLSQNNNQYIPEDYTAVDMEDYLWRWGKEFLSPVYVKKQKIIPISTGIGCAYSCNFCINSNKAWKEKYKIKSKELLLSQLEFLAKNYQPEVIWFQDDNFFINKERAQEALEFLNQKGIKWAGQGRLNYFRDDYINEDFFKTYISPGALWFGVGFETFSDNLRQKLNKKVTYEQLERAAYLCDEYEVPFNPAFMFGLIEQTKEELKADVLQLIAFHKKFPKTTFSYQLWRPYPGTEEYKKLEEKKAVIKFPVTIEDWLNFDYFDKPGNFFWLKENRLSKLIPYNTFLVYRYCNAYNKFGKSFIDRLLFPLLKREFCREKFFLLRLYRLLFKNRSLLRRPLCLFRRLSKTNPLPNYRTAHHQRKGYRLLNLCSVSLSELKKKGNLSQINFLYNPNNFFKKVFHCTFNLKDKDIVDKLNDSLVIVYLKKISRYNLPITMLFNISKLLLLVNRKRINAVRARNIRLPSLLGLIVARLTRIPYIVSLGGDNRLCQEKTGKYAYGNKWMSYKIEELILSHADAVIVPNKFTENYVKTITHKKYKGKIVNIPWILEPSFFEKEKRLDIDIYSRFLINPEFPFIAVIGFLNRYKFIDKIIDVAQMLIEDKHNVQVVFCGGGPLEQRLRETFSNVLNKNIYLLGWQNHNVVMQLLKECALVWALMSGFVILEAAAMGAPIITSNKEWHSEFIIDGLNGYLVDPDNKNEMLEKTLNLLTNKTLLEKFKVNAKEKLNREYCPADLLNRELNLYSSLMS
jgi:glycosyltransferase involved in cell wall biosynthesis